MRLVWFVLNDGRSLVAGCEAATRDSVASAISEPGAMITFASDGFEEEIPGSAVRDFVVFESRSSLPAAAAIYRVVHL